MAAGLVVLEVVSVQFIRVVELDSFAKFEVELVVPVDLEALVVLEYVDEVEFIEVTL